MKCSVSVMRSRARHAVAAAYAGVCVAVVWSGQAHAQSASLDPDLFGLSPRHSPLQDRASSDDERHPNAHAAEHLQLGALVGVSFPRPLSVEGVVKLERLFAVGAEYSALPALTVSGVQVSAWAVTGSARFFPFRGPFFLGLRAGRQHVLAAASASAYGYTVPVGLNVDTTFLNPQLGFLWTWRPGFSLGVDVGVQIPLSSQAASSVQAAIPLPLQPYVAPAQDTLESVAKAAGQTTLPTIDLIRIGFLF